MSTETKRVGVLFLLLSLICSVFYYFYLNFSTDLIILFLAEKIFLGKWLARGIVPFFNPHLFAGIPFLFDVGMGNLHPFNLFFILPYPLSFSVWIFFSFMLFLSGFYLFFRQFTKTSGFALICVLILFFSGSGYWRVNNPTIFLVIAHFGLFFYFLNDLKTKSFSLRCFLVGGMLALSGHVQFVLYGFILSFLLALLVYKISFKKVILFFAALGMAVGWYFLFSSPLFLNSTRITTDKDYSTMGRLPLQQVVEFMLPLFFGYVNNGSSWNVGPTFVILISPLFSIFVWVIAFISKKKSKWQDLGLMIFLLLCSFGLFNFPFFRAPSQILLLFHVWGLLLIARNEELITSWFESKINCKLIGTIGLILSIITYLFFSTSIFSNLFNTLYTFIKKRPPNLFFDIATIRAIGELIGLNFVIYIVLFGLLIVYSAAFKKKQLLMLLSIFIVFEGIFTNYFHNYFMSQDVFTKIYPLPSTIDATRYRVQTGADVIPYFGFHNYMGNILFRPPFSKEPSVITKKEEQNRPYLRSIMSYYPSTWAMTYDISSVQGYNTFVTKDIADYFKTASDDYKTEYAYILSRNNVFGQSEKGLAINGIETSRITLNDPRWEQLGVKYFISDRPLKKYKLLEEKNGRYVYENPKTVSIFRIVGGKKIVSAPLTYFDPNQWKFAIGKNFVGAEFQMVMNSSGFVASVGEVEVPIIKEPFLIRIPHLMQGELRVSYSPLRHLQETIQNLLKKD